jgi:hypothetical protein
LSNSFHNIFLNILQKKVGLKNKNLKYDLL